MPRSIQEILDHADELAQRFEDYEPQPGDERPVEEYLLERAALARARGERQIVDAVTAARAKGISWQRIGELLGTSAQAAQQRDMAPSSRQADPGRQERSGRADPAPSRCDASVQTVEVDAVDKLLVIKKEP